MTTKKTHGGARSKAGRKPIKDKKVTISVYPRESEILLVGGIDNAKLIALSAIERKAKLKKS